MRNLNLFSRTAKPPRRETCPVTGGIATRMTKTTFDMMCRNYQDKARGKGRGAMDTEAYGFCRECRGSLLPVGLEFIG